MEALQNLCVGMEQNLYTMDLRAKTKCGPKGAITAKFRNCIFCTKFFCVSFVLCLPAFTDHIAGPTSDSTNGADWRLHWRPESSHTTGVWLRFLADC
jgi:hypothetical protein